MAEHELTAAGRSDRGLVRPNNEDGYLVDAPHRLFLVADGLGGHAGGELASSLAVEVATAGAPRSPDWTDPARELPALLMAADAAVRGQAVGPLANMGTTVVALHLRGERCWIAHAGDSRAYRLRDGDLQRLTVDHTPEMETGWQLPGPGRSGMITRALGIGETTRIEVRERDVALDDRYLLCSDGLTDAVSEGLIAVVLRRRLPPAETVDLLIEAALAAGGPDNVTTVVVDAG